MITKTVQKLKKRGDLAKYFANKGFNIGYEIGTCTGKYAEILCQANPNLVLKTVDPFTEVFEDRRTIRLGNDSQQRLFEQSTEKLKPYKCEIVRKESLEAARDVPYKSIDFVYIDGSHEFDYVMTDIIEWTKRVRRGGIVSGHDYYNFKWAGVVRAVDTYCQEHRIKELYLTKERTPSWWFIKTW